MPPKHRLRRRTKLRSIVVLATAVAILAALATSAAGQTAPALLDVEFEADRSYAPGEAIVRFERGTGSVQRRRARTQAATEFESTLGLPQAQLVEVEGSVEKAVRRLERQPGVAYAQPNYRYEATAVSDDTFSDELWGLDDPEMPDPGVGVAGAWSDNRGAGQVIAILDTGVDLTHPDIAANLWINPGPDPGDDDLHGYDFVDEDGDPDDYNFHGTHVAATAAAVADNEKGVAGVAPEAEIMAVRVLDGDGSGSTADIAAGIAYAAENGANVINMSLGGPASGAGDEAMSDAIDIAATNGAVVVVAAGNEGADNDSEPHTPCALDNANLICVAALNRTTGALASFSNYGAESVDLAAPGTSILSAKPDYRLVFGEDFDSGFPGLWTTRTSDGGVPWGASPPAFSPPSSATDSPGGDYGQQEPGAENLAASELLTTAAVDLTAERGCRIHFRTQYEVEPPAVTGALFDAFVVGAVDEGTGFDLISFAGTSSGYPNAFLREQVSISALDGQGDAHPIFGVLSDESLEFDGAYVDDVRLLCRDGSYLDQTASGANYDQPASGSYVPFNGTSMATPHVAGMVALVRAAEPGLSVAETIEAVLVGVSETPNPDPGRQTVTGGIADTCRAVAVATGSEQEADCPGSSPFTPINEEPVVPPNIPVEPDVSVPSESESSLPPPPASFPAAPSRVRPRAFFRKRPRRVVRTRWRSARVAFVFGSTARPMRFACRIDRWRRWWPCPRRLVRRYRVGWHVVRVRPRDATGKAAGRRAAFAFRVKRVRRRG